jgi:phage shock protein B
MSGIDPAVLALMIPILVIVSVTILVALAILTGKRRSGANVNTEEEARLIQDIYHGLLKMEERVEALETLLLEREREADKKEAQS